MMRVVMAMSLAVAGVVAPSSPGSVVTAAPAPETGSTGDPLAAIVPVTPARVLDTRQPIGVGVAGAVPAGGVVDLDVLGRGGVPVDGVGGVVLNVTIAAVTAPTFVTVWPTGEPLPEASSLNALPGQVFANLVVAKVGDGGMVSLYNRAGTAHLIADVAGWVPEGADLTTITPSRLMDTRDGTGGHLGKVGPGGSVELNVFGAGGVPDNGVGAVIVNVTATAATAPSFVTVWPMGEPMPNASSVNMIPGRTVPNLVVAKAGVGGRISLFNGHGETHLIVDVVAWTTTDSALVALTPDRVLDTRNTIGGPTGAVDADTAIELEVIGVGGVPDTGVTGVLLNVTTTAPTAPSFVTTWPNGLPRPEASSLNMLAGETVPNLVLAPVGAGGKVRLYNLAGQAHLIADVVAYLEPAAGTTAPMIADETIAVSADLVESIDGDPDADEVVTITFDADAEIEVGSIVVAQPMPGAPSGLLRRVTAIVIGPGGVLVATAERATLTDAVPEGSFDVTAADGGLARLTEAPVPLGTRAYDRKLECKDELNEILKLQTSADGGIDSSIEFALDWDLSGLRSANVTVGLDVILNLQASATAALTCEATAELFTVAFSPIAVPIAGVPFFFVPELTLELKATGSLKGSLSGTADYGVQITAGIVYDEDTGIDTVAAVTPTATSDWNANAAATAGVELTPKLVLAAYGLGGPEAGVPFGVSVDLDPCRTPLWKLTSSIKASIGIALTSWLGDLTLAQTQFTLNENTIAQGGDPIPDFPGCDTFAATYYRVQVSTGAIATRTVIDDSGVGSTVLERIDDEEHRLARAEWWAGQGDVPSKLETRDSTVDENDDLIAGSLDVEITEPYDGPVPTVAPGAVSAAVPGASASATGAAALDYRLEGDNWVIAASAQASADEEGNNQTVIDNIRTLHYASAGTDARVELEFDIASTVNMTFSPACPPDSVSLGLRRHTPPFVSFVDASGCIAPATLTPGHYELFVFGFASGGLFSGGGETFTMTLSPP